MSRDQINMAVFRNASFACLTLAAAAFIVALVMFFLFDIRTIFMIRNRMGKAAFIPMNQYTEGDHDPAQEFSFRIVRKVIITDTDGEIVLQDTRRGMTEGERG